MVMFYAEIDNFMKIAVSPATSLHDASCNNSRSLALQSLLTLPS